MTVDSRLFERTAKLSKLSFDEEQKQQLMTDMQEILMYMEKLNQLDTEKASELTHPNSATNVLREDKAEQFSDISLLLKNAPDTADNCFAVPKAIL